MVSGLPNSVTNAAFIVFGTLLRIAGLTDSSECLLVVILLWGYF